MKLTSSMVAKISVAVAALSISLFIGLGCETGGNEGDVCNPLVQQDECDNGLSCQQITCAKAYCCPTGGSSNDPNCNGDHCPSDDAGDEGGEAGTDEGGTDAAADSSPAITDAGNDGG
jgi:hypothetical protein